jgi:membrane-associated phospholipid phosphatase
MTSNVDSNIVRFFNQFLGRAPDFDALVSLLADSNMIKGALLLGLMYFYWHQPHGDQLKRRQVIIATVIGAIVAASVSRSLSHLWQFRMRPFQTPGLGLASAFPQSSVESHGSFPSDHAALAFGLTTGFFFLSLRVGLMLAVYVTAFICFPRLYLGLHWPSDLLGGAIIGIVATALACRKRVRVRLSDPPLRLCSRSPQTFNAIMFLIAFGVMTRFDDARVLVRWAAHSLLSVGWAQ